MGNPNKTTRTILRWTHVLVGFLIGVFVYTSARDSETFVLLMQAAVLPAVILTGAWMWQQARIRRLLRRLRSNLRRTGTNGLKPPEGTHEGTTVL
ncbi:hypothetical protein GBA65_18205 [Rubrobacter marinus]|uniref:Uncharacterized protein n=1 Tax=Rubrobacter marinus TaxID=2653852 RepID=A0A6G8Q0Y4_9ACTN|nr:hypothetical protein [Rubrobacter marinus]QIN80132.1 hypothetical protein GBA65_18205 [Rubrobacter marinus]